LHATKIIKNQLKLARVTHWHVFMAHGV